MFFHWICAPEVIRPRVPGCLELDLHAGLAWISIVAFAVSGMRLTLLPALPLLSEAWQINVRTYVHRAGIPGLWFFSLDTNNPLAVWGARLGYRLPYHHARITAVEQGTSVAFHAARTDTRSNRIIFDAQWQGGERQSSPRPGTLDSFLLDRYVLYSLWDNRLLRARIHHRPWPLRQTQLTHLDAAILDVEGFPGRRGPALLHGQADPFDVEIWAPTRLRD